MHFKGYLTLLSLDIHVNLEIECVSKMVRFLIDPHVYYRYSKDYHYIITVRTYVYMYVKIYMHVYSILLVLIALVNDIQIHKS